MKSISPPGNANAADFGKWNVPHVERVYGDEVPIFHLTDSPFGWQVVAVGRKGEV